MFQFQKVRPVLTSLITLAVISTQSISNAQAEGLDGNIRIFGGGKNLDKGDWQSMDSQSEIGLLMDFKKKEWPVSIALDLLVAGSDSNADDLIVERGYTSEIHLGVRKTWDLESADIHPYVGGGISYVGANFDLHNPQGESDDIDNTTGTWIGTGIYWNITPAFNIGFDMRYSFAEVTLLDKDIEAGGMHSGLTVGFSF